jgi:hypothetical protein
MFSFVPFNEPDMIWYNKSDRKQAFFDDWKAVYRKIKSIDPTARIVGPNLSRYDSSFYRDFLTFGKNNNCLPDVISWHELNDDFFTGWYSRFEDYRSIEISLGIPVKEICINEYGRKSGDLGIPGKLVQWIARFENSKVDACLAYWTDAGSLNNLVARDNYNQATGGWWLYRWYGGMTGNTVKVTPPNANSEGLQGLASVDSEKKQVRILFGGYTGSIAVVIKGFDSTPYFGSQVHGIVWVVKSTGLNPSSGPTVVMEGDYTITDGQITIAINNIVDTSAYQMIITPARERSLAQNTNRYEAEFADILGSETIFVLTAKNNGFYNIRLRYSTCPVDVVPGLKTVRMMLNGSRLKDISVQHTTDREPWADVDIRVFLTAGINRIAFDTSSDDDSDAIQIDYIEVTPGNGPVKAYEAEASDNTLCGIAAVMDDPAASGGKYVGNIGNGGANTLEFNIISVPESGTYRMIVYFANAEFRGEHAYNNQIVDRYTEISVNGGGSQKVYFRNTFAWDHYQTRVVDVDLHAGRNTIKFSNHDQEAYAPHIDKIEIAACY